MPSDVQKPLQPRVGFEDAVGQPETGVPPAAARTSRYPISVFSSPLNLAAVAGQPLIDPPFEVPADGYLLLCGAILGSPAHWQISFDGGATWLDLNDGADLKLGAWDDREVVHVRRGRTVTVGVSANTTIAVLDVYFIADA
jgi:hypothetical protein